MIDAGIGRLLVASLHQAIADLLPTRLEFYESWINPAGLRDGRIGLAPLAAVLSFLRQEGEPYQIITARAGEYAAEWTFAELSSFERLIMRVAPRAVRLRLGTHVVRKIVRNTYGGSRAIVRWKKALGTIAIRDSVFCGIRDRADQPLCAFYASAARRLMDLFDLDVEVGTAKCRATGEDRCVVSLVVRSGEAS